MNCKIVLPYRLFLNFVFDILKLKPRTELASLVSFVEMRVSLCGAAITFALLCFKT